MALIALLLALSAQPSHLVLGKDFSAELTLQAPASARVEITASVGAVTDLRREGQTVRAKLLAPRSHAPSVALLLATIDDGADRTLQWLAVPLWGSDTLELETRPHSSVEVSIGAQKFGPVAADAHGVARVPVVVPPGVQKAKLRISDKLGNVNEKELDLDPPPFPRMRMAPRAQQAYAGEPVEVEIFAVKPDGTPDDAPSLALAGGARAKRDGTVYVAEVEPAGDSAHVSVEGGPSLDVPVRPAAERPARGALSDRREWALSIGPLLGAGVTFDGAATGAIDFEGALRLGRSPLEAFVDLGGVLLSDLTESRGALQPLRESANAIVLQLGLRMHKRVQTGLDVHAGVFMGVHDLHVEVTPGGQSDGWGARFGLLAGATAKLGPGRLLFEVRGTASPSGVAGYTGSLAGVEATLGYLLSIR